MKKIYNLFLLITTIKNFHLVLIEYLLPSKNKLIKLITWKNQIVFCRAGTTDYHEVISVLSGHEYPLQNYLNLSDTAIIINVGAHIGTFDIYCKCVYPKSLLYSFEPNPENFKILKKNIVANHIKEIFLIKNALSDSTGICKLYFQKMNPNEGNIFIGNNYVEIRKTNLDTFSKKYKIRTIDLLKLDCEGAEFDILNNIPNNLLIKNMAIEYHSFRHKQPLKRIQKILGKNYELVYHKNNLDLKSGIAFFKKVDY
jgi:FkbM family methyltransferase